MAQLRDRELDRAGARVPAPWAVAVALRRALARRDLADLRGDLRLHQLGDHPRNGLAHDIGVVLAHQFVRQLGAVILRFWAIGGAFPSSICERTDDSEAAGGRPTSRPALGGPLHHFYDLTSPVPWPRSLDFRAGI